MKISPFQAKELYVDVAIKKCLLCVHRDDSDQESRTLITVGIHSDLGRVIMIHDGLAIDLDSQYFHDLEPFPSVSIIGDFDLFEKSEHEAIALLDHIAADADSAGLLEVLHTSLLTQ